MKLVVAFVAAFAAALVTASLVDTTGEKLVLLPLLLVIYWAGTVFGSGE